MPELLGYEVETNTEGGKFTAYWLRKDGKRKFYLMRAANGLLFACNATKLCISCIQGHTWFTDKKGVLEPCD